MSITRPVCLCVFVALGIKCAILSPVASLIIQFFFASSNKRQDFRKYMNEYKRVFRVSLQLLPKTFFILSI
jgi:hypothetical protein